MKVYVGNSPVSITVLSGNSRTCFDLASPIQTDIIIGALNNASEVHISFNLGKLTEDVKRRAEDTMAPSASDFEILTKANVNRVVRVYRGEGYSKALIIESRQNGSFYEISVEDVKDVEEINCISGAEQEKSSYYLLYKYIVEGITSVTDAKLLYVVPILASIYRFRQYGKYILSFDVRRALTAYTVLKVLLNENPTVTLPYIFSEMMHQYDLILALTNKLVSSIIPPDKIAEELQKLKDRTEGGSSMYL